MVHIQQGFITLLLLVIALVIALVMALVMTLLVLGMPDMLDLARFVILTIGSWSSIVLPVNDAHPSIQVVVVPVVVVVVGR